MLCFKNYQTSSVNYFDKTAQNINFVASTSFASFTNVMFYFEKIPLCKVGQKYYQFETNVNDKKMQ